MRELGSIVANRYVLKSYLGEGRYGEIYKAVDRSLSDPQIQQEHCVALHLLHDRIAQQTRLLQKLENSYHQPHFWSHPNIVKVRGFGCDRGKYFLAMELLDGVSLRSILDDTPSELPSEAETLAVLRGVGDALKYAHAKGAIHGDIRPEKIFVTHDYAVKVLDLLPTSPVRTLPYFVEDAAPNGLVTADQRDDVYGLACLAYELLAGRHPFNANSPLEALNAGLTLAPIPRLGAQRWAALARGLALRREHRTPSVAAFLAELGITGHERLHPASETAPSETISARPPVPPAAARDADVSIIDDHSTAGSDRVQSTAAPPLPEPQRAAIAESETQWQRNPAEFEVYRELASRRERREPRRTRQRFAPAAVLTAAVAVAVYWNYQPLRSLALDWLAMARTFAPNAPNAPNAPSPGAEEASEVEPPATVAAPPIAAITPDLTPGAAEAPSIVGGSAIPDSPAARATVETEPPSRLAEQTNPLQEAEPATPAADASEPERFEFVTRVVTVSEGQAVATLAIRRRGGSLGESSAVWWTSEGSASADDDYANLGARVEKFAAGEETRTIRIPIVVDSQIEDRESFYVNVRGSEQPGTQLEPTQQIEIVVVDDD